MSALRSTCGLSTRLLRQAVRAEAPARALSTAPHRLAAHAFNMPALSPTMTEGNIAAWRVREGDAYAAGDVLLEIETDKATMDVEAQEDGILVSIMQPDGAKAVQVGTRIGVTAEPDDDIKTLEMPPGETTTCSQQQQQQPRDQSSGPARPDGNDMTTPQKSKGTDTTPPAAAHAHQQRYPLLPSVEHLVKQHQIQDATLGSIKPTGPGGRLLKGDVLAHLGEIDAKRPAAISAFFDKLSRLDLSDIKLAKREPAKEDQEKAKKAAETKETEAAPAEEGLVSLDRPVSLEPLLKFQARVMAELGAEMPLSVMIKRAVEAANATLPPLPAQPSADDMFDNLLGLPSKPRPSATRGTYSPVFGSAISTPKITTRLPPVDIIDVLAAKRPTPQPTPKTAQSASTTAASGTQPQTFGLLVPKNEKDRADFFLAKLEHILTNEPGKLLFR